MQQIIPSHNHDHFWIQNGHLFESYMTPEGLRCRELISVDYEDTEDVPDCVIDNFNEDLKNEKTSQTA